MTAHNHENKLLSTVLYRQRIIINQTIPAKVGRLYRLEKEEVLLLNLDEPHQVTSRSTVRAKRVSALTKYRGEFGKT